MRVVLVSSPGHGPDTHWSQPLAAELARRLVAGGASVQWMAVLGSERERPQPPPGTDLVVMVQRPAPLHQVAAGIAHAALELALTKSLRSRHAEAVVHLGVGARGSPNVLWLADRMGSKPFAAVRASEVVCQRSDLVDREGLACATFDDPQRCRACCARSWLQRPRAGDLQNRLDLLVAGLQVAASVFVASSAEGGVLDAAGVPLRNLAVVEPAGWAAALAACVLEREARAGSASRPR